MNQVSQTGSPCYEAFGRPTAGMPRTYVIFGVPRGGTTMVAGVARLCGLPIGENLPPNQEDSNFNLDSLKRAGREAVPAIKEAIELRNAEHVVWGWKYPRSTNFLRDVRSDLRDPRLILVLRDPVASSGRAVIKHNRDPMEVINDHHRIQTRNLQLVSEWQVPTLLVSYERAIDRPLELIEQMTAFLGLPPPANTDRVLRFIRPGTYQKKL